MNICNVLHNMYTRRSSSSMKERDMARYTVAVAGATGYAGGEALRILAAHPDFEVTCVAGHSSVGQKLGRHMPHIPQLRI